MSGAYETVAEGLVLVSTLVFWNWVPDWGSYRWKPLQRLTEPPPLLLIDRGRVIGRNLRREFMTHDDLESQLRQHGVDEVAQVRKAYLEGDGKISVPTFEKRAGANAAAAAGEGEGSLPGAG